MCPGFFFFGKILGLINFMNPEQQIFIITVAKEMS